MTNRRKIQGQNITEYLVLIAGVLVVVILATNPRGFFTQGVNKSLDLMLNSVDKISKVPCLGTLDDDDGGWSDYGSWGPCSSCTQTHTRTCTNPPPKCSGKACVLDDGTLGLLETQTQACTSGSWVVGSCGVCTGNCGSTAGTCTQSVTCNGGCCDSASQPASTIACAKPAYPDVWSALGFGACSVSCGVGVASQTVTCSGSCCNAGIKPPTTQACFAGCCQVTEPDITSNGAGIPGTFPNTPDGQSATVACPSGYTGNPAKACSGTTWGPLTGLCDPDNCPAYNTTVNGVSVTLPGPTASGSPQVSVSCSSFDNRYDGTVFGDCLLGAWTVTGSCAPKSCPAALSDPNGLGLWTLASPPAHGTTVTLNCSDINSSYTGQVSATCDYGSWTNLTGGCVSSPCPDWTTLDPNGFVNVRFTAAPNGTPQTVHCQDFDSNYTGDVGAICKAGTWGSVSGCCNPVSPDCPQWDHIDAGNPNYLGCLPATPNGQTALLKREGCSLGFSCPWPGYYTSGSFAIMCRNGVWDPVPVMCVKCANTCPARTVSTTAGTGYLPESQCGQYQSFYCPPPANYTGYDFFYCNTNGTWIQSVSCTLPACTATCSPTECGSVTKPDSCGVNKTITCRACVCTNIPSNATGCSGDTSGLTVDTPSTLVDSTCTSWSCTMQCTTTTKCEYYCPYGYTKSGNSCIASCTSPCGNGTILTGNSDTCYSASSVACDISCDTVKQTATCVGGYWNTWNPSTFTSYTNKTCTTDVCKCAVGYINAPGCPAGHFWTIP